MADPFPSADEIAQMKAIQATRPQLPQPTPDMITSALYGLVSNPALDRLRSGQSFDQPPITPETKPGYLGPSPQPWADAYVGGLLGGASLVGGPEMLIAKGLSLGAKALGGLGLKSAAMFAPKVGEKLGAQEMLKAVESKLTPTGSAFVASPEAVKAGIASQEKGGGPWYTGLSNEDIAHTLHGIMHTPGHGETYINAFEKLPQDVKPEVAEHINNLLQQSADDALKKLQGAMKAPEAKPSVAPAPGGGSWLTPQEHAENLLNYTLNSDKAGFEKYKASLDPAIMKETQPIFDKLFAGSNQMVKAKPPGPGELAPGVPEHPDLPGMPDFTKTKPYDMGSHLLDLLNKQEYKKYGETVASMPLDYLDKMTAQIKKEGWDNIHAEAIHAAEAEDPAIFGHVPGGKDELIHGTGFKPKADEGWAGYNSPADAASALAQMHTAGDKDIFDQTIQQMPYDFWMKVKDELPNAFASELKDPYAQVPFHAGPAAPAYNPSLPFPLNPADVSAQAIEKALMQDPGASIFDIAKSKIKGWEDKTKNFIQKAKGTYTNEYSKHLKPLDWMQERSPETYVNPYETEPLSKYAKPMQVTPEHIQGLGFNPDLPLYKGGSERSRTSVELPDPGKKDFEKAQFFAADPDIAKVYSAGHTGEYYARAPKAMEIDYHKATGTKGYEEEHLTPIIDAARAQGADMLVVRNMRDIHGSGNKMQDQYLVLNPSIVRRKEAAFDPNKLNLNNLLAGLAGFGVVAPVVGSQMGGQNGQPSQ